MGLAKTYFMNPDYLVTQCWVHAIHFSPYTINQTESHTYHYTKFSEGLVGYTLLGFPCTQLMAVIDFFNTALPSVFTVYLAL